MKRADILKKLNEIFCDVFDDEMLIITDETTADDIEDWDSLEHINLVAACEKAFSMKFDMFEISQMKNVGDMVSMIAEKLDK